MHAEIVEALLTERVREARANAAAAWRYRRVRGPRRLLRNPRPRLAWATGTV
jgi:hypothetical protein